MKRGVFIVAALLLVLLPSRAQADDFFMPTDIGINAGGADFGQNLGIGVGVGGLMWDTTPGVWMGDAGTGWSWDGMGMSAVPDIATQPLLSDTSTFSGIDPTWNMSSMDSGWSPSDQAELNSFMQQYQSIMSEFQQTPR